MNNRRLQAVHSGLPAGKGRGESEVGVVVEGRFHLPPVDVLMTMVTPSCCIVM